MWLFWNHATQQFRKKDKKECRILLKKERKERAKTLGWIKNPPGFSWFNQDLLVF